MASSKEAAVAKLKKATNNVQITEIVKQTDYYNKAFQKAIKLQKSPKKDSIQSEMYRQMGNVKYVEGWYPQALALFNQSICFAPNDSVQLSKGYANRSVVYFKMNMFHLALKNIKLARDTGYPAELMPKLIERELKCKIALSRLTLPAENFGLKPKLTYPAHEKADFIANCLELKANKQYGRHIVTNTDLKVGDVVITERLLTGTVPLQACNVVCANCLRENRLDLIPCQGCHSAMFCSSECYAQAMDTFHDIECPIMDILMDSSLLVDHSTESNACRLLILAVKSFKTVDELVKFTIKNFVETHAHDPLEINYEATETVDLLAKVLKLDKYIKTPDTAKQFGMGFVAGIISSSLVKFTKYKDLFVDKKEMDFLIDFLCQLLNVTILNTFPVTDDKKMLTIYTDGVNFCSGIHPFSSIMNHSCAANVKYIQHGTKNVAVVVKPIKEGEQLFTCYLTYHHTITPTGERKDLITKMFDFECNCVACAQSYPVLDKKVYMKKKYDDVINPILHQSIMWSFDMDATKKLVLSYSEYLNANSKPGIRIEQVEVAEDMLIGFLVSLYSGKSSFGLEMLSFLSSEFKK